MMTRSSSSSSLSPAAAATTQINIAASAKKLDVNHRIPLRIYFRTADNVLRKADIFRQEDDIIDQYVTLLRFSSLAMETIPRHREYRTALQSDKNYLKKKLLNVLSELEELQPVVQRRIEDLNRQRLQVNNRGYQPHHQSSNIYPPAKQLSSAFAATQMSPYVSRQYNFEAPRSQQFPLVKPFEEQFRQINLNIPRPREETLARHSIFGPNGLHGQWQPPPSIVGVRYPSNIDFSPVNIPSAREDSAQKPLEDGNSVKNGKETIGALKVESLELEIKENKIPKVEEPASLISFETVESPVETEVIRQPSPPPVLAEVQDLVPSTPVAEGGLGLECSPPNDPVSVEAPLELHISTALMDSFMRMAKSNTNKNLETCGVLAGSLKNRRFSVTALIIPKQESTSDSVSFCM
ncbi:OLC1v1014172C4 [Oldenlandia corymbosa var. corymbosa]|uniref:OLC1v1014172C4 n=1 Tax=Oldenlandia corymbosa var. corymbosa TaxID=529605 RepID=A0AAV1E287_OLDCO|nr:OLC1v1014172C4 [Oldenlandia corymbosa var. corymbosa]